jgi:hypothetical protein
MRIVNMFANVIDGTLTTATTATYELIHRRTVSQAQSDHMYRWLTSEITKLNHSEARTMKELTKLFALHAQRDSLEIRFSPAPQVEQWLESISGKHPARTAVREIVYGWQRLIRGWDDRAMWNLDAYLCRTLGEQLTMMADSLHGWPSSEEFSDSDAWAGALRFHGGRLLQYRELDECVNNEREAQLITQAQESLTWVANHLPDLWD